MCCGSSSSRLWSFGAPQGSAPGFLCTLLRWALSFQTMLGSCLNSECFSTSGPEMSSELHICKFTSLLDISTWVSQVYLFLIKFLIHPTPLLLLLFSFSGLLHFCKWACLVPLPLSFLTSLVITLLPPGLCPKPQTVVISFPDHCGSVIAASLPSLFSTSGPFAKQQPQYLLKYRN